LNKNDFTEGIIINGVPFMPLLIRNPEKQKTVIIELLLDSGAQHTMIPKDFLYDKLGLKQENSVENVIIRGIIPKEECFAICPTFSIDFFINRQWLRGLNVVAFESTLEYGILGRNILQFFNLNLDFLNNTIKFLQRMESSC
jgi:hypothetical protein